MTDGALSEAAMLASLRDIHLPAEAAGGTAAELAATVAIAACLALILTALLRLLSLKRRATAPERPADRLARIMALPAAERRVALLHLLRAQDPARYAALRPSLYRPEGGVDTAALEAEVSRLV